MSEGMAVVGLGRVGLPFSVAFASRGLRVVGVDRDPKLLELLRRGLPPFREEGLEELLAKVLSEGRFTVTGEIREAVEGAETVVITVGTPLGQDLVPDLTPLYQVVEGLSRSPLKGKLIVLRSTVPPGTTENVGRILAEKTGLEPGRDFHLAYCPERILEGRALEELRTLPEIVGGWNEESSERAARLFRLLNPSKKILKVSPRVAELAKLFTNIYRYVNFALANQLALVAEHYGVDAYEAIRVANEDYPRSRIPLPGPAGGPCLYKDGYMLNYTPFIDFIKSAWHLNESIPLHLLSRMKERVGSLFGKKVALLGLAVSGGNHLGSPPAWFSPPTRPAPHEGMAGPSH
jgi:UDP-N-acetyl-D-mannosaminuronic acid dehydrogenase